MKSIEKSVAEILLKNEDENKIINKAVSLIRKEIGYKLLTFMIFNKNHKFAKRIYTSNKKTYPLGKSKKLPDNFWAVMTVKKKKSFVGNNKKEIEKYFYDHKVITSLGCESILNQVVIFNDETIGTINILHKKNYFTKKHLEKSNIISKCLVSTFINKRKDITYGR
tara:strand:- start:226 stop:723 length:498 start_codon:yes stop_codon:yes gene_type:complete